MHHRTAIIATAGLALAGSINAGMARHAAAAAPSSAANHTGVYVPLTPARDRPLLGGSSQWMIEKTPHDYSPNGSIADVSCSSADACTAVGWKVNKLGEQSTLAERWNGKSWTIQGTPNPPGNSSSLVGVSCPAADVCVAVGNGYTSPFSELWSGERWTIEPTPLPGGGLLTSLGDVSCASASSCVAVGFDVTAAGVEVALSEIWNGTSWRAQPAQNPLGNPASLLDGVACTAATACTAVGGYQESTGTAGVLAETWNGHSWKLESIPQPSGTTNASLDGVSCPSAASCIAVGSYIASSGQVTLAEAWNGTSWQIKNTPNPAGAIDSLFDRVSCGAAGSCVAVGYYVNGSYADVPMAEAWNGGSWVLEDVVSAKGMGLFSGTACWTAALCIAVGNRLDAAGTEVPLAEARSGSGWATQAIRNAAGALGSAFEAVSCPSARSCTAVGSNGAGSLAERSSSGTWQVSRSAERPGDLYGVSCATTSSCVAVGVTVSGNAPVEALSESWNGTTWALDGVPAPGGAVSTVLDGVSCPSRTFCMAVGTYFSSTGAQYAMAETWNGRSWAAQSPANPSGSQFAALSSVWCTRARTCVAVGSYASPTGAGENLAEAWDGASWTIQSVPEPGKAVSSGLLSVSCASATSCAAVGSYFTSANAELPTADVWNGSEWTVTHVPDIQGSGRAELTGVSCPEPSSCTAVGLLIGRAGLEIASALAWNGATWVGESTPGAPGATATALLGTSCPSPGSCTAVGGYLDSRGVSQTLAEVAP